MKPIRILHENVVMDVGGIETLLMNIYRNIDRDKVQFDFMVHREHEGFFDKEIIQMGGKIYKCKPFNPLKHMQYLNSIRNVIREHQEYKIMHAHSELNMWPLRIAKQEGIPIRISHSHNTKEIIDLKWLFMQYEKLTLKNMCTDLFACSDKAAIWLYGNNTVKNNQVKYIKNGVETKKFDFNLDVRNKIRNELNIKDKFVIGHVGRFMKQKNHSFIIDIFTEIKKLYSNSVLLLIGEGKLQEQIKNKVDKMNLSDSVKFIGVKTNVNEYLQAMDCFVLPSFYEGLGIVLIEAQTAGLPCIVSDIIPEEAFQTNIIKSISLKKPAKAWANEVLKFKDLENRYGRIKEIDNAGFNIINTTKWLESYYIEKYNNL